MVATWRVLVLFGFVFKEVLVLFDLIYEPPYNLMNLNRLTSCTCHCLFMCLEITYFRVINHSQQCYLTL